MILDAHQWSSSGNFETDFLVIGGGISGITIALELSNKFRRDVLLVEGGKSEYSDDSQILYEGVSSGQFSLAHGLRDSRQRMLGGGSNCWAGGLGMLDEHDFHERYWVNDSGWPIEKKDLLSWYKKAAKFLKVKYESIENPLTAHTFKNFANFETKSLEYCSLEPFQYEHEKALRSSPKLKVLTAANFVGFAYEGNLQLREGSRL